MFKLRKSSGIIRRIYQRSVHTNDLNRDIYIYDGHVYIDVENKTYKGEIMDLSKGFSLVATVKGSNFIENTDYLEREYITISVKDYEVELKNGAREYSINGDLFTNSSIVATLRFLIEDKISNIEQLFLSIDGDIILSNQLYTSGEFNIGDSYKISLPVHYYSLKAAYGNKLIELYENILEFDDNNEELEYNIEMSYYPSIMNKALQIYNLEETAYSELPELNLEMFDYGTN